MSAELLGMIVIGAMSLAGSAFTFVVSARRAAVEEKSVTLNGHSKLIGALQEEVRRLHEQLDRRDEQLSELRRRLDEVYQENTKLRRTLTRLQAAVDALRERLTALGAAPEDLPGG